MCICIGMNMYICEWVYVHMYVCILCIGMCVSVHCVFNHNPKLDRAQGED